MELQYEMPDADKVDRIADAMEIRLEEDSAGYTYYAFSLYDPVEQATVLITQQDADTWEYMSTYRRRVFLREAIETYFEDRIEMERRRLKQADEVARGYGTW